MNLCPTKSSESFINIVKDKTTGIKPRFTESCCQCCEIPSALFGVQRKGLIVDIQPCLLVLTLDKCADCNLGRSVAA